METHRDPHNKGWRSLIGSESSEAFDESEDNDPGEFIDAGHRVLVHFDRPRGGPGLAGGALHAIVEEMREDARNIHILRVLVLVATAILAAYIYTSVFPMTPTAPGAPDLKGPPKVATGQPAPAYGRSMSEREATVSLIVYALIEAARRQNKTDIADLRKRRSSGNG